MDYKTLTGEDLSKWLLTAPMHEVHAYHDWKMANAQKQETKYYSCKTHGAVIQICSGGSTLCDICEEQMEEISAPKKESTTLADTVSVPKYYNKDGSPVKFGPKVLVSRKALEVSKG